MKILPLLFGSALTVFGAVAHAHAHLERSSPAEGSVVTTSPSNLVLNFSEAARLTALKIQAGDGPSQAVKALPSIPAQQISIPLPALAPGLYSVSWRVVSDDGHVMAGVLHFTLTPVSATSQPVQH